MDSNNTKRITIHLNEEDYFMVEYIADEENSGYMCDFYHIGIAEYEFVNEDDPVATLVNSELTEIPLMKVCIPFIFDEEKLKETLTEFYLLHKRVLNDY